MKHFKNSLMNNLKNQNEVLVDLLLGILIIGALILLVGLVLVPDRWRFAVGILLGTASSVGRTIHMSITLERQMDYSEKDATAYAARNYAIRYISVIVVMLLSVKLGTWGIVGTFIGVLLMKPAALIAPKVHKYVYTRIFDKGR